ncbi:ATP-binding protein [Desertimonas flava]|uniref:ATP-binding protein n=1 Tax=Desertimonas flava TaxID=2064846 RepID=UPI000E354741|nr:ATP-binding protein [Desertimonas flava]
MTATSAGRSVLNTLRLLTLAMLMLAVIVAFLSLVSLRRAHSDMSHRVNVLAPAYLESLDRLRLVSDTNALIFVLVASGRSATAIETEAFDDARRRSAAMTAELADLIEDEETLAFAERAEESIDQWWAQAAEVVLDGDAASESFGELVSRFADVRQTSGELGIALKARLDSHWQASSHDLERSAVIVIAGTLTAAGLTALLARLIARSVSRPVLDLAVIAGQIREGDVDSRADEERGPREVRQLAAAFNALTAERNASVAARDLSLDIAAALRDAESEAEGLVELCRRLGRALDVDRCDIFSGPDGEVWSFQYGWQREGLDEEKEIDLPSREFATAWVHSSNAPIGVEVRSIPDAEAPDTLGGDIGRSIARAFRYRAMLSAPIRLDDRVAGVLLVRVHETPREWTDAEVYAVRQASEHAANAIAQRQYLTSLEALDRQKSEFLATASHELRTPLTSIAGYLEVLEDGDLGEMTDAQLRAIAVIRRNTARLRGLIEDILVINRIEERGLMATFLPVSIARLLAHLAEELRPIGAEAGVALTIDPPSEDVTVDGVADQLGRALTNVIGNAIKFTPAGGHVSVRCVTTEAEPDATGGGSVQIVCSDTGVGIPTGELDLLSTRFFRASNATAQAIPGTGLGLSIVRSIVELHAGTLAIDSEEGVGTTVTITLPRRPATPA